MREQNPLSPLFSYCPSIPLPSAASEIFARTVAPRQCSPVLCGSESQGASVLTFSVLTLMNVAEPKSKYACIDVIRLIQSPVMNENPYGEKRTSCVLWPPRILTDARCPQHAWQGFQPVHPTKEGVCPLCWILPQRVAEAAP